ncbi:hypothetical protein CPLU01_09696 [Colletotrichum plurivorum]|uniref:Uncharacterized protein n=1 Tax=Colletotrichum plurivorum TaxID=2175906 RepID=A0A8H6NBF9_9PEZI|nr:hypothetical protein CPLU01_09696 [Colletotrichum plurivorum]
MATSTTTIHVHTSPSASKSEVGNHTELNAQGVNRSNEDPGSMARRIDALVSEVEDLKDLKDVDQTEIVKLEQSRDDLNAQLASAKTYNAFLAEKILRLQEQLSQVSRFQSHLDEQDLTYIQNGPSSTKGAC